MSNFDVCFYKLIFNEGGYVNDKDDSGGETYMGISRVHNPNSDIWPIIDKVTSQYKNVSDINRVLKSNRELSIKVKNIYKKKYWDVFGLDKSKNINMAYQIFDSAVNIGVNATKKLLNKIK